MWGFTNLMGRRWVEVKLIDVAGKKRSVIGYTVSELCGKPFQLELEVLASEFPDFDPKSLQRPTQEVDIMLGSDYFSYFSKQEVACSRDLSVMVGPFGKCVQGSHPSIVKGTNFHPFTNAIVQFEATNEGELKKKC